jgi:hypothetical protein
MVIRSAVLHAPGPLVSSDYQLDLGWSTVTSFPQQNGLEVTIENVMIAKSRLLFGVAAVGWQKLVLSAVVFRCCT